jgi:Chaperone of endosialidase
MKTTIQLVLSFIILCLVAVAPTIQAVVPPPDGGYPGGNTAEGQNALFNLTSGGFNTAIGWVSLHSETTASFNTAVGAGTLFRNNAEENTAIGTGALLSNTAGYRNTATGAFALFSNTGATADSNQPSGDPGSFNTANGYQALFNNTTGAANTAVGFWALINNTTGFGNTAIGNVTLSNNSTGNNNIALGTNAGGAVSTANNVIAIGTAGQNVSDSCYIGNIFGASINGGTAMPVSVDADGKLGTVAISARRFKDDIKPMDKASEAILALKPVAFHYKADPRAAPRYGLVAEDVAAINPNLVTRNKDAEIIGVQYDQVWNMLLNEFLKEHRKGEEQDCKIQEQETMIARQRQDVQGTIAELKKEIASLTTTVKEQAAQIHKVSAQVELNRPAPRVANKIQ